VTSVKSWLASPWARDAAIALVVTAAQVAGDIAAAPWTPGHRPATLAGYLLLMAGGLSLAARRRYPVLVLAITLATTLAAAAEQARVIWLALIVAFFTAVLARKRAAAVASLVIGYLVSVWPPWQIGRPGAPSGTFAAGLAIGLVVLLGAAELLRVRSERAAALARGRDEELRRRASEERMRMARDLHDVVAHSISVINVQATTALHLMDRQPDRARTALVTINDVSKQALAELRTVLGVLRDAGDGAPRAPAPGLARLGDLVDNAAAAGLAVQVLADGSRPELPASVDLAAYRIIQEALTNSARHSGAAAAAVRLGYRPDGVLVEITDDGRSASAGSASAGPASAGSASPGPLSAVAGTGTGIAGMTERAAAIGGTLTAGPRSTGGFAVRAWLPT
jgi:signal transduction histidine kinase